MDNSIDHLWKIDVKKSSAEVPDSLKRNLKRLATRTRNKASEIYRARGEQTSEETSRLMNLYGLKKIHQEYHVTRLIKHILMKDYIDSIGKTDKLNELLTLIEKTVPIEQIIMTNNDSPDSHISIGKTSDGEYEKYKALFLKFYNIFLESG